MNDDKSSLPVDWNPELSSAALEHIERLRNEIEPQVSFVRQFRNAMGYSQLELADILDVTQSAISKIEGRDDASLRTFSLIAKARGKRLRLMVESENGEAQVFAIP